MLIPYVWKVYSVVIMPPSFPYGGMENPYLTFVSPSIILGDKSSAYIAAHEICHSWFGNLVTNRNWTHFWLNEGFARYAERLIIRRNYNESRYRCQTQIGIYILSSEVQDYINQGRPEYTKLAPNPGREGPDDILSDIPYEKGFLFLTYLEQLIKTEYFYGFLRTYLNTYAYRSVEVWETKAVFEQYVTAYVPDGDKILKQIDWNTWLFGIGMPKEEYMNFTNKEIEDTLRLVECYQKNKENCDPQSFTHFILDQKIIFVQRIRDLGNNFTDKIIQRIEKELKIVNENDNPEIISVWIEVMVRKKCIAKDVAKKFLSKYGRMKYIVPIFDAYSKVDKPQGRELFNELKHLYHPIANGIIEKLFN